MQEIFNKNIPFIFQILQLIHIISMKQTPSRVEQWRAHCGNSRYEGMVGLEGDQGGGLVMKDGQGGLGHRDGQGGPGHKGRSGGAWS